MTTRRHALRWMAAAALLLAGVPGFGATTSSNLAPISRVSDLSAGIGQPTAGGTTAPFYLIDYQGVHFSLTAATEPDAFLSRCRGDGGSSHDCAFKKSRNQYTKIFSKIGLNFDIRYRGGHSGKSRV